MHQRQCRRRVNHSHRAPAAGLVAALAAREVLALPVPLASALLVPPASVQAGSALELAAVELGIESA